MKEITIKNDFSLSKPRELTDMATILKSHIVKNRLYVPISGRNYIMVEGWQFAGGLLGLFPRIKEVIDMTEGTNTKWQAWAEIIDSKTGNVVGSGVAICAKSEKKKVSFDEYAVLSMAQTRAIGKAYRNLIGWVMKMTGYESTPAEEVSSTEIKTKVNLSTLSEKINTEPAIKKLKTAKTKKELQKIWQGLSGIERLNPDIIDYKDLLKTELQ